MHVKSIIYADKCCTCGDHHAWGESIIYLGTVTHLWMASHTWRVSHAQHDICGKGLHVLFSHEYHTLPATYPNTRKAVEGLESVRSHYGVSDRARAALPQAILLSLTLLSCDPNWQNQMQCLTGVDIIGQTRVKSSQTSAFNRQSVRKIIIPVALFHSIVQ